MKVHWTHRIENFFTVQDFWATCSCPEKQSATWQFSQYRIYFCHSGFLSTFALALKNRVALKIFTVLNILLTFRIFEQLALALKNRVWLEITVLKYIFSSFRILEQHALALKNKVCPEFTALKYFLSFRIFEQLALDLKTEFSLKFFKTGGGRQPPASYGYGCGNVFPHLFPLDYFTFKHGCDLTDVLATRRFALLVKSPQWSGKIQCGNSCRWMSTSDNGGPTPLF